MQAKKKNKKTPTKTLKHVIKSIFTQERSEVPVSI